jgi:hypothetical protein
VNSDRTRVLRQYKMECFQLPSHVETPVSPTFTWVGRCPAVPENVGDGGAGEVHGVLLLVVQHPTCNAMELKSATGPGGESAEDVRVHVDVSSARSLPDGCLALVVHTHAVQKWGDPLGAHPGPGHNKNCVMQNRMSGF